MSKGTTRKPAAFILPDETPAAGKPGERPPAAFTAIAITEDRSDPFGPEGETDGLDLPVARPRPRRLGWGTIALSAGGLILSLAIGLWLDGLIADLFARSDWLGWLAAVATALFVLATIAIAVSEWVGLRRLAAARDLRETIEAARHDPRPAKARAAIGRLSAHLAADPATAAGRAALAATEGEIIDSAGLIQLAERELMGPLDARARALVLGSAKRVSIVTAISPRALVDLAYVLFESARLVRAVAEIYGARPGRLGFIRLFRDVLAHLAVTGSIAVGDNLIQQFVGHGLAAKLSARLGEGVINGMMTARIGIAAMDLCRPLAFHALKRPGIGDILSEITGPAQPANPDR